MPTNSQQNTPNKEEIDLITLFVKTGELIKKAVLGLINVIGSVLVFLLRKWFYLLIAVVLTIASALILDNITEPQFSTDLIMRSNTTTNQPIMSSVNKLGDYAKAGNHEILANELSLSLEDASSIRGIETFWYYDIGEDGIYDGIDTEGTYLSDTNVVKVDDEFVIRMKISDPNLTKKIETGLLQYLEANPILEALNKQRLSDLEAQLNQTQYEIEKLDSLQKREYYTNPDDLRQKDGQIVFTSEKIVRTYHTEMFKLLKIQQEYERDINIYSGVVTIQEGFSIPSESDNRTIKYAKKLIWYFLGLAILIAVLVSYRKKIWVRI